MFWFFKRVESLQKLLSIMMGRPTYAKKVSVPCGDDPFWNCSVFFSTMPKVISQ
ncbi:hypothetical protein [Sulfoacidibacillus ferrooxidans]|uniref:ApeA N-terminal domain 1-containing protein n=1 Tax=Sulfoacidibacillus ferrooxidans TaxID=2005001 RepID=UPI003AFA11F2